MLEFLSKQKTELKTMTQESPTVESKEKAPIYYAHFSKFVRNTQNLRDSVEREELLTLIKADGGVKIPGYVYSEFFNVDGLMRIFDMNSRHWCLEQLEKDEEYKKSGGSFDLPYLVLPDEIALDPVEERLFMISLGTANQNLSIKQIGRGYLEAKELGIEKLRNTFEGWDALSLDDKEAQEKKFATKIINHMIKKTGKSKVLIYQIARVYEAVKKSDVLAKCFDENTLSVSSADELLKVAEKTKKPIEQLLSLAEKSAFDRGNNKVTDKDIELAAKITKHPEMESFVISGVVPTDMFDAVLDTAKKSKTPIGEIVTHCASLGGVSEDNLIKVADDIINEDDLDDEDDEDDSASTNKKSKQKPDKEIAEISDSEISEAGDYIKNASLELANFVLKDLTKLDGAGIMAIAEKLEKAMRVVEKHQS